jgi:hypothetical protein
VKINKLFLFGIILLTGCSVESEIDQKFTFVVIPDTQNIVNYTHQLDKGFPVDGGAMFIEHMEYIASNIEARGGEVAFVTSVGDVWQHTDNVIDPGHYARGLRPLNPAPADISLHLEGIKDFELPLSRRGYDILAQSGIEFSVVPGNHDYNTAWMDSNFPIDPVKVKALQDINGRLFPGSDPKVVGMRHYGGLETFNSVFGDDSDYFKDKSWYISSFNGGANSAQIFEAGGYKFLHFGFEMQAGQAVIDWAQSVIDKYPGLPTMMTTHDYIMPDGERKARAWIDFASIDPTEHLGAEQIWQSFLSKNDQIFMVFSGHYQGQAYRVDNNDFGNSVYQLLSNYQGRGQSANPKPGERPSGLSDGWLRLMNFDFSNDVPTIDVRTYSTYYKKYSNEIPEYANWYKNIEQPEMSDAEFKAADHFTIELGDFKKRFGEPK